MGAWEVVFIGALTDRADGDHLLAQLTNAELLEEGHTFLTTNFVLDETLTLIRYHVSHKAAVEFWYLCPLHRGCACLAADRYVIPGGGRDRGRAYSFLPYVNFNGLEPAETSRLRYLSLVHCGSVVESAGAEAEQTAPAQAEWIGGCGCRWWGIDPTRNLDRNR